ncbi:MAG: helix-turn-helix domain-containing protein [Clostridia bacterium]|nr:helix-turn-helix domain-containing protein [Clostridia bacterium]
MSQLLCMSEQSVRNLIKENNIPVIPGTKNVLVRKETFDNFINQY